MCVPDGTEDPAAMKNIIYIIYIVVFNGSFKPSYHGNLFDNK